MSRRARELGALNLGQGFPDYDIDPRLARAGRRGHGAGSQPVRSHGGLHRSCASASRRSCSRATALKVDPQSQITVTLGATEAIYSAIQAVVGPGDEVIVFDPSYDSYEPAVRLAGGACIRLPLLPPEFRYDWDRVRGGHHARTRLILFNTPAQSRPARRRRRRTSTRWRMSSAGRDILVMSDEVYEHVCTTAARTLPCCLQPELAEKSFAVFSFGKTMHATGLRVGYCVAAPVLTRELRKVHQFNTFSISHPLQHAIAAYLAEKPDSWRELAGVLPGEARPGAQCAASSPDSGCRRRRARIFSCWISASSLPPGDWRSPSGC